MSVAEFKTYRWTVARYDRLTDCGAFDELRIELLCGKIIQMPRQTELQAAAITLATQLLLRHFTDGYYLRTHAPLHLGRLSKPEPDLAVVVGGPRDYVKSGTPTTALLLVEVAETTLALDRGRKASLYARFGISDYWVLNLIDRQFEVHRQPIGDAAHRYRFRYAEIQTFKVGESVVPLADPDAIVHVDELLP